MQISGEELKGKVGEGGWRVYKTFLTLYIKSPFCYFLCILPIRTWIEAFTVPWEGWQAWGTESVRSCGGAMRRLLAPQLELESPSR